MTTTSPESRARIAYTAYCRAVDFKAFNGDDLPTFDNIPPRIQQAWVKSADTIWQLATTGKATI